MCRSASQSFAVCCNKLQCVAASLFSLHKVVLRSPLSQLECGTFAAFAAVCRKQGVLQCVAVCYSVLQCAAVCCSVENGRTMRCSVLQSFSDWYAALLPAVCSVLQCVAVCCNVVQCLAVRCSMLQYVALCCRVAWCIAVCCNQFPIGMQLCCLQCVAVLRCVAACCMVVQCVAVWCSVLQYVAACCRVVQCVAVCHHNCISGMQFSCCLVEILNVFVDNSCFIIVL